MKGSHAPSEMFAGIYRYVTIDLSLCVDEVDSSPSLIQTAAYDYPSLTAVQGGEAPEYAHQICSTCSKLQLLGSRAHA